MRIPFFDEFNKGDPDAEIIQKCDGILHLARDTREQCETDWLNNILYSAGNQWESVQKDMMRFTTSRRTISAPETGKVKLVNNLILPLKRQAISSIYQNRATQEATPATSDPEDVAAAEIGSDLIQSRYFEDNEQEKQLTEINWCCDAGSVMRKTYYDPDADGIDHMGIKRQGIGDIVTEVLNPFQFYVAPWYDSQHELPWIIESEVKDVDEINDLFSTNGKSPDVQAEEIADSMGALDRLLINVVENREARPPKRNHAAILNRLYHKPTKDSPQGKVIIWAGKKLLAQTELPEGELPHTRLQWFPIVGRIYPLPFVSPLRGLQQQINIIMSQLIEMKNRKLRGDIVIRGTGTPTVEYVENAEGQKTSQRYIRVPMSVQQWEFMQYELGTSEAETLLAQLWNYMQQIAGIHDTSLGQRSPSGTTAREILMLKDSDLSGLTLFRIGFDLAYSKVSRQKLLIAKNHYDLPRMARVVGENNSVREVAFRGANLRNTEDVRPKPVPLVSETLRIQMKAEAVKDGLYGPYAGPEDMLAKIEALLNSGIPDVREEVDQRIAPMTLEELRKIVSQINTTRAKSAILIEEAKLAGIIAQINAVANAANAANNPPGEGEPGGAGMGAGGEMEPQGMGVGQQVATPVPGQGGI